MTIIDDFFSNEMVLWVNAKVADLPNKAKFRAFNAIRSLNWASQIYKAKLPIPATYCALHATEEAVAAFVSSVKVAGYGDDAKINIRDHHAKAAVSLLAQKTVSIARQFQPALALMKEEDFIALRITESGEDKYGPASMSAFTYHDDNGAGPSLDYYDAFKKTFESHDELLETLRRGYEARNRIFYADDQSIPPGFQEPEVSLLRECQISVGLIWAAIDVTRNTGTRIPFYEQALRTANLLIEETKRKKDPGLRKQ